jgi:hypothetical protein
MLGARHKDRIWAPRLLRPALHIYTYIDIDIYIYIYIQFRIYAGGRFCRFCEFCSKHLSDLSPMTETSNKTESDSSTSDTVAIMIDAVLIFVPRVALGGRDSSVGIATRYGLDGPGIESRWGRDFSHTSRPTLGPTQPPIQWVPGLSRG